MLWVLLFVITLVLVIMIASKINSLTNAQKRKLYWQMTLCGLFPLLFFKLIAPRFLIFFMIAGVLIPALRAVFVPNSLIKNEPKSNDQNSAAAPQENAMNVKEALNILGLDTKLSVAEITEEMVINAHRALIQKFHPDRGGNDYLAAKINDAKDFLIKVIRG